MPVYCKQSAVRWSIDYADNKITVNYLNEVVQGQGVLPYNVCIKVFWSKSTTTDVRTLTDRCIDNSGHIGTKHVFTWDFKIDITQHVWFQSIKRFADE